MFFFSGGGRTLTGVDVGASAVKVISGKKQKNTFVVDNLAIVPLHAKCVDERGIVDAESVVSALLSAFEQIGKRNPTVATAVRGPGVLTKKIIISRFPKKEIPDQVRWEAEQVFPMDTSTIFVEHLLVGEVDNLPGAPAGTPGWEILLIGVRQETATTLNDVLASAGAKAEIMDLDALVVADFIDDVVGASPQEVIAFVDVGASGTRVSVKQGGHVIFIREFQIGGNAFTEAIAHSLGLSFEDAESIKIQDGSGIPQEAQEAIQNLLKSWKVELQQCEDIFVTQDSSGLISRWVIFGGGAYTPGLLNALRDDHFGEKTVLLPASEVLKPGSKNIDEAVLSAWAPRLMTAAGLAARKTK